MSITITKAVRNAVVADACHVLAQDVDQLSVTVSKLIVKKERYYAESLGVEGLVDSVRSNLLSILDTLSGETRVSSDAPRQTGRLRAEQGVPLLVVERAYRLGMSHVWDELVRLVGPDPDAVQELLRSTAAVWQTLDQFLEVLAATYFDVETEQLRQDSQQRREALTTLFTDLHASGLSAWRVASALRIPINGTFAVIATDSLSEPGDVRSARAERSLAAARVRMVWSEADDCQLMLAVLPHHYTIDQLARALALLGLGRVGLSATFPSLSGAAAAARDARAAWSATSPGSHEVLRFEDARLALLLVSAPGRAADIYDDVLGGLCRLPHDEQDLLLGTLRAWYEAKGSTAEAGRRVHCHANTVRNRLAKLADLTRRDLSEPIDVAHLYLALEARRLLI